MPTPIIDLQRRLAPVGALRAGGEKPERGVGRKLESFRLTSPRRDLIEQAAQLYGGDVTPWQSPVGPEWQTYTTVDEIPVLVMPGYSLRQSYEKWEGATKRTRLCDGTDEELSGGECICNATGVDECDLYTRLVVALPELDTVLGWRLITRGANAGAELPGIMGMIETLGRGQTFVPARIRLDNRRGVKDGQVVRYVVPVLDLGVGYLQLAQGAQPPPPLALVTPERPAYTTIASRSPGIDEALDAVTAPRSQAMGGNQPDLPRPTPADFSPTPAPPVPSEAAPASAPLRVPPEQVGVPVSLQPDSAVVPERQQGDSEQTRRRTDAQAAKLNVLVGTLRDGGHITTASLYDAIGGLRGQGGEECVLIVGGYDAVGQLHWAPLRDSLDRAEASQLIDWLEIKEQRVREATG